MQWAKKQTGFTIVELLIVIVVIAVLAAIVTVAYNGVTQKAKDSAAKSAAQSAAMKLATYAVDNSETFPASLAAAGVNDGNGVTFQYSVNSTSNGYCVTAVANGTAYYTGSNYGYTGSSSGTVNENNPTSGACPGHTVTGAAAIKNYATNPGVEVNAAGMSGPNSSTTARDTSKYHSGVASLLVTMPVNNSTTTVGAAVFNYSDFTTVLEANTTYTVSLWVWVPTSTVSPTISIQGSGRTAPTNPAGRTSNTKNQWVRLNNTFTTLTSGSVVIYVLNNSATTVAGTQYWIDDVMLVKGTEAVNYADGNSTGWVWNGTANNSSSNGPAL